MAHEIHTVASKASVQLELQRRAVQLGATRDEVHEQSGTTLIAFLHFVENNFRLVDIVTLEETSAARYVFWIIQHPETDTRDRAISVHTQIREYLAAGQRAKRARH